MTTPPCGCSRIELPLNRVDRRRYKRAGREPDLLVAHADGCIYGGPRWPSVAGKARSRFGGPDEERDS